MTTPPEKPPAAVPKPATTPTKAPAAPAKPPAAKPAAAKPAPAKPAAAKPAPAKPAPAKPAAAKPAPAKPAPAKPAAPKKPAPPEVEKHFDFREVEPAGLRLRHMVLIAAFVVIVVIPTCISAWLSWHFAGSLRQVTASVTVQEQSLGMLGSTSASATVRSAFTGSGAEETAIVRQLVNSEDFYRAIREQIDLSEIWPADRVVPYLPPRYPADGAVEKGHVYWGNMVSVNLGSRDHIIRITVTAFDQASAERLLQAIRVEAERRLNLTRTATLSAARTEAERRLEELRIDNAADREALKEFRLKNRAIDPQLLVGLNTEFKNFIRSMLVDEEITIALAEASVGQSQGLTRRPEDRIAAIRAYIDDPETSRGMISTPREIAQLIEEYQPLITDAEISGMALRLAELSIIHYNRELESNKVFLTSVTGGTSATIRSFPEFGPTLIVVMIGTFIIWCMVLLTFYAIRDRK